MSDQRMKFYGLIPIQEKWESIICGPVVLKDIEARALVRKRNEKFTEELLNIRNVDFTILEPLVTGISWKVDDKFPAVVSEVVMDGSILDVQSKKREYSSLPDVSSFEARKIELLQYVGDTQFPHGPCLISMSDSEYSLAPHNTDTGDLALVFDEYPITIILRKSQDRLHIVGRALIQGLSLDAAHDPDIRCFLYGLRKPPDTKQKLSVLMDVETLGFLTRHEEKGNDNSGKNDDSNKNDDDKKNNEDNKNDNDSSIDDKRNYGENNDNNENKNDDGKKTDDKVAKGEWVQLEIAKKYTSYPSIHLK